MAYKLSLAENGYIALPMHFSQLRPKFHLIKSSCNPKITAKIKVWMRSFYMRGLLKNTRLLIGGEAHANEVGWHENLSYILLM